MNHLYLLSLFLDKVEDNVRLLEGHASGVCNVRWGHGDSKLLVSASFDNTVRVWDTTTASCLAVYHSVESVFCAIFSPIHENIVIFVGKGTTLAFVDYTKHPPQPDGGKSKLRVEQFCEIFLTLNYFFQRTNLPLSGPLPRSATTRGPSGKRNAPANRSATWRNPSVRCEFPTRLARRLHRKATAMLNPNQNW